MKRNLFLLLIFLSIISCKKENELYEKNNLLIDSIQVHKSVGDFSLKLERNCISYFFKTDRPLPDSLFFVNKSTNLKYLILKNQILSDKKNNEYHNCYEFSDNGAYNLKELIDKYAYLMHFRKLTLINLTNNEKFYFESRKNSQEKVINYYLNGKLVFPTDSVSLNKAISFPPLKNR